MVLGGLCLRPCPASRSVSPRWLAARHLDKRRVETQNIVTIHALPGPETHQCFVMESWVREHGWTAGCEVGVLRARNLFHLLDRFPFLSMIAVDQWLRLEDSGEPGFETYASHNMEGYARFVTDRAGAYDGRCTVIRRSSVDAAHLVQDGSLDFVFIDACHTEAAVRADIAAWTPKLKPSGYLTGHDRQRPEVRRVLNDILPGWEEWPSKCWRIATNAIQPRTYRFDIHKSTDVRLKPSNGENPERTICDVHREAFAIARDELAVVAPDQSARLIELMAEAFDMGKRMSNKLFQYSGKQGFAGRGLKH